MSDYLRRMADQLEKHHREFHSAPVLDFSVIALRHGADRIEELEAENARLREALTWYRDNVAWCNNFGHEGAEARDSLAKDTGQRANAALQEGGQKEPFSEYGHYGENNPPVGMSSPGDKDYEV